MWLTAHCCANWWLWKLMAEPVGILLLSMLVSQVELSGEWSLKWRALIIISLHCLTVCLLLLVLLLFSSSSSSSSLFFSSSSSVFFCSALFLIQAAISLLLKLFSVFLHPLSPLLWRRRHFHHRYNANTHHWLKGSAISDPDGLCLSLIHISEPTRRA